jgi:hypothetical protein
VSGEWIPQLPPRIAHVPGEPDKLPKGLGVSRVGRTEIRRVFAAPPTAPIALAQASRIDRFSSPPSPQGDDSVLAPILLWGSRIALLRSGLGDRNSNSRTRATQVDHGSQEESPSGATPTHLRPAGDRHLSAAGRLQTVPSTRRFTASFGLSHPLIFCRHQW